MKKIFFLPILILVASWTSVSTTDTGMVFNMKIQSTQGLNGTIRIYYDQPGTRSEINATMNSGFSISKVSIIKKSEPNLVYQLDAQNKTYSTVEVSNAAEYGSEPATAQLIGNDSMNGYWCKHVKVKQGTKNWEIWNTTAIAEYASLSAVMNRQRYIGNHGLHDALKLINAEGFPVKIILTDKDGTTTTTLESMSRQKLSPTLFEVPADYKKGGYKAPQGMPSGSHH